MESTRRRCATTRRGQEPGLSMSRTCWCDLHIFFVIWTTTLLFVSSGTTMQPSIGVVTTGEPLVHKVKLWDRASLFCRNYLLENNYDLSHLPPEDGPCHVNWYKSNGELLCQTVDGKCQCDGSRKVATHGGVILVVTRVTQAASGSYTCKYPSVTSSQDHYSHMEFRLDVDTMTRHLSLYDKTSEEILLPTTGHSTISRELPCWFNGNPTPTVVWTKDGVEQVILDHSGRNDRTRNITFSNLSSRVRQVVSMQVRSRKDMSKLELMIRVVNNDTLAAARTIAGLYKCHVRNAVRAEAKKFSLIWDYPGRGITAGASRNQPITCAYSDQRGLCLDVVNRFVHDPFTGSVIDCVNMTDKCPYGVCIAAYEARDVNGACEYQQTIGRCQPFLTDCEQNCTARPSSSLHNSTIQCCCQGDMCNQNVQLPSKCHIERTIHHCNRTSGFFWNATSSTCEDVNECDPTYFMRTGKLYIQPCGNANMRCTNTVGSFTCRCKTGYHRFADDDASCVDIDECAAGSHDCRDNEECDNTAGSYTCEDTSPRDAIQCEVVTCGACSGAEADENRRHEYHKNATHCCWLHDYTCPSPRPGEKVLCTSQYDCLNNRPLSGMCATMRLGSEISSQCHIHCEGTLGYCYCEGNRCNHHSRILVNGRSIT